MKLNQTEKKRLRELNGKSDRTEEEESEFQGLKARAEASEYDYEGDDPELEEGGKSKKDDDDDPNVLDEDGIKSLVKDAVTDVFKSAGLDKDTLEKLGESIDGSKGVSAEDLKKAINDALGGEGVDEEALAKELEKRLKKDDGSAKKLEDVEKLVKGLKDEFAKVGKRHSRMIHQGVVEVAPVGHRKGNLSVAEKQLLNICMMHAKQEALDASDGGHGIKRPEGMNDGISEEQLAGAKRNGEGYIKSMTHQAIHQGKAAAPGMMTDAPGFGAELINTELSSEIVARMYLESEVAARLLATEIEMPTGTFKLPVSTTRPTFYRGEEARAAQVSRPGTGEVILDAKKMIAQTNYSYEAEEDSIIPLLGFLQGQLAVSAADALEQAFINGDDSGNHMDSDVLATLDQRKVWKGFRKYAIEGGLLTSFATGGITAQNIGALRKSMGRYGIRPQDLMIIAGVNGYNDLVMLDETLTVDKVGQGNARILTGVAPQIFGIPIIVSAAIREDLNAAGVYDGAVTDQGSLLLVHRSKWMVGRRRNFTIEVDKDIQNQCNWIVASFRRDFVPLENPSATEQLVAMAHGYAA